MTGFQKLTIKQTRGQDIKLTAKKLASLVQSQDGNQLEATCWLTKSGKIVPRLLVNTPQKKRSIYSTNDMVLRH